MVTTYLPFFILIIYNKTRKKEGRKSLKGKLEWREINMKTYQNKRIGRHKVIFKDNVIHIFFSFLLHFRFGS